MSSHSAATRPTRDDDEEEGTRRPTEASSNGGREVEAKAVAVLAAASGFPTPV
jgi:hypothetical protein